jgi:protein-disulfide isomerase
MNRLAAGGLGVAGGGIIPGGLFINQARAADEKELLKPGPLGDNIIGDAKAPVTIIEYASMTCPHCAAFHMNTYPKLKEKYIDTGKMRLIFREFPLDNLSLAAFMLMRCVDKSKYFAFVDILFKKQREWSGSSDPRTALFKIAKFAGLTKEQFDNCIKNEKIARAVREVGDIGSKKFNVDSTPTFFINGKVLRGNASLETFEKRIAEIIK